MGCKAEIRLNTTADGQHLIVKAINELHNHEVNEAVFKNLFQQRRLDNLDKENIANMLQVKANKKMIQQKVMSDTGKIIHLKDIHNIRSQLKSDNTNLTTLQSAVDILSKSNGAFVKLVTNDNRELRGLFFQDERMRSAFDLYPEFVCVDATYKVNDLRMPLYVLLIENGNGQSEIVCMWLVAEETEDMMSEMVKLFKQQNPKWENVKIVMSDKDFVEREVFSKQLPKAELRICLFHVLRTFRREITAEKMGVNKAQRDTLLQIFQKIAYSNTVTEYDDNRKMLMDTKHQAAIGYFNQSWHPIKDQWVAGLSLSYSLGNKTNNRLESINQKIKQVVDKNATFDSFASDIVVFLEGHRTEINGKACKSSSKVPVKLVPENPNNAEFRKFLTPFAYNLVEKQLNEHLTTDLVSVENGIYKTKDKNLNVSQNECACAFNMQYMLPCKHMFALRATLKSPLFEESLVPNRWSKKQYMCTLNSTVAPISVIHSASTPRSRPLSQQQRFRAAHHVAQRLASCAAEQTNAMFEVRLKQLNDLLRAWECGEEVAIEITNVAIDATNVDKNSQTDLEERSAESDSIHPQTESTETITHVGESDEHSGTALRTTGNKPSEHCAEPTSTPQHTNSTSTITQDVLDENRGYPDNATQSKSIENNVEPVRIPQQSDTITQIVLAENNLHPDNAEINTKMYLDENNTELQECISPENATHGTPMESSVVTINSPEETDSSDKITQVTLDENNEYSEHATQRKPIESSVVRISIPQKTDCIDTISQVALAETHVHPDNSDSNAEINPDENNTELQECTSPRVNVSKPSDDIGDIVLPPKMKKRGRPKGSELTVIGLPKKRLKLKRSKKPFEQLHSHPKLKIMLSWFVDDHIAESCLSSGHIITEDEVECRSDILHMAATDMNLDPLLPYFDTDAWKSVSDVVSSAKLRQWTCRVCFEKMDTRCVGCDLCLHWFHYHCAAITETPKTKFWFCCECCK